MNTTEIYAKKHVLIPDKSYMMSSQTIIFLSIITIFFFSSEAVALTSNYLPRGSSLSVEHADSDVLISPDKTFTCGFYGSGANAYWLSIWFTNSKERTVVWMANRDSPVNGHGSRLTLGKDGALVLTDLDGSLTWETNTTFTNVNRAELLDSGNLVLKDPTGKILWQSFDFPTDTLLPNQSFNKNTKLISRIAPHVFHSGYFTFYFDNDNVLKMIYDGPEISSIYWPTPGLNVYQNGRTDYNSSRIAILDNKGTFVSSDRLRFSASDVGSGIKRRLTMDYDGNLRVYSLNDASGLWAITWQAVARQCDVHGLCGRNGICIYTPEARCSCPPYHEPADSMDWSKGCKAMFKKVLSGSHFLEIPHVDYYGFDLNFTQDSSFSECKTLCSDDYRCQGFKYVPGSDKGDQSRCYTKGDLFNGHGVKPTSIYLRIPTNGQIQDYGILNVSHLSCEDGEPKEVMLSTKYQDFLKHSFKWIYMYCFAGGIAAIEVIILVASWFLFLRKYGVSASLEDGYRAISSQFRGFSYVELKRATGKFKQVLGRGGFGVVYKGVLADERVVAVKKLEDMTQGEEEFWAEVSTLGRINHINLVRMWGFCSEGKHKLLVYEYVQNGSLDKLLFTTSANSNTLLGWEARFKVAIGTAKGLAYLHHECLEWVIHCDVKPENILLDHDFEPKISDFGLAKLCQRGGHGSSELSEIRGTKGYMAPEWTTNLPLTAKVDVYSYGVVILELVRGVRLSTCAADDHHSEAEMPELTSFARLARRQMQDRETSSWMENLVDSRLEGKFRRHQAAKMIEIGLSCVEDDRNKRPTMELVVQVLAECEGDTAMLAPESP